MRRRRTWKPWAYEAERMIGKPRAKEAEEDRKIASADDGEAKRLVIHHRRHPAPHLFVCVCARACVRVPPHQPTAHNTRTRALCTQQLAHKHTRTKPQHPAPPTHARARLGRTGPKDSVPAARDGSFDARTHTHLPCRSHAARAPTRAPSTVGAHANMASSPRKKWRGHEPVEWGAPHRLGGARRPAPPHEGTGLEVRV